jgi:transcriptional regulator with GAF, ATPase, and Fis domain
LPVPGSGSNPAESSTPPLLPSAPAPIQTRAELKQRERESIQAALKETKGKVFGPGGAAELLGMKPTTLASRIQALGLRRGEGE